MLIEMAIFKTSFPGCQRKESTSTEQFSVWGTKKKKIFLHSVSDWPFPCTRKDAVNFFKTGQQNGGSGSLSACTSGICAFKGRLGDMCYIPL